MGAERLTMSTEQLLEILEAHREGRFHLRVAADLCSPDVDAWLEKCTVALVGEIEDELERRKN